MKKKGRRCSTRRKKGGAAAAPVVASVLSDPQNFQAVTGAAKWGMGLMLILGFFMFLLVVVGIVWLIHSAISGYQNFPNDKEEEDESI